MYHGVDGDREWSSTASANRRGCSGFDAMAPEHESSMGSLSIRTATIGSHSYCHTPIPEVGQSPDLLDIVGHRFFHSAAYE